MESDFELRGLNQPQEEIIPRNRTSISIDRAIEESAPVVNELSKDISGIGQKAAERYLLRYEYGMATGNLASEFGVTPQTISNQVSEVRSKVLKYPRHARNIGNLRSRRAGLSKPDLDRGQLCKGEVDLKGETLRYDVEYEPGSVGDTYDWIFSSEVQYESDSIISHLFVDYIIDSVHGVMLKRVMRATSLPSWKQPPLGEKYSYKIYPLPNLDVPNDRDGTLLDGVEYNLTYDIKNYFERIVDGEINESDLARRAKSGDDPLKESAYYARDDVLTDRIRACCSPSGPIQDYKKTNHIRRNLERIMRMYPYTRPFDLPAETVTLLWNGQPSGHGASHSTHNIDKQALYDISTRVSGRYREKSIRQSKPKQSVDTPRWLTEE